MSRKIASLTVAVGCAIAGLVGVTPSPAAAAAPGSPVGVFSDSSARFDDVEVLSGFALDPDAPGQPIQVRVTLGLSLPGSVITTGPGFGITQPIVWSLPSDYLGNSLPADTLVCATAINVGPGSDTLLGCRSTRPTSGAQRNPVGSLDSVGVAPGLVQLRGWAGDPDGDRTTQIRVYADGKLFVEETANLPRADVARVFPAVGPTTGFNLTLPMLPGAHHICAYAQNTGPRGTANGTVGCTTRSVPGVQPPGPHDPRGAYDRVYAMAFSPPRSYSWSGSGWAYDPDTGAPINVRIRTVNWRFLIPSTDLYANVTIGTGRPRPDVQRVVPAAGPDAGFDGGIASTLYVDPRLSCAYAVNVGPGASRFLGCHSTPPPVGL